MATTKRSPWEDVYAGLRTQIDQRDEGPLPPGTKLPTEYELADEYEVARGAVRRALSQLEAEGAVSDARAALGRHVRVYEPLYWHLSTFELGTRRDDPDTGTDEWSADMRAQGREPRQEVEVKMLKAPANVADYLDVEPGTWLFRRRRLRFADDIPVTIADTWLPEDIAKRSVTVDGQEVHPFLEERDVALDGGIVRAVGIRQVVAEDEIFPRMPTKDEAELLGISPVGSPVGEHVRVGIDDQDRRVRVLISVFPGHRLSLKYRLSYAN